jgi:hypothetical protein
MLDIQVRRMQGPVSAILMGAVRTNALVGVNNVPVIQDEMKPTA